MNTTPAIIVGMAFAVVIVFSILVSSMTFDILSHKKPAQKLILYTYVHRLNDRNWIKDSILEFKSATKLKLYLFNRTTLKYLDHVSQLQQEVVRNLGLRPTFVRQ